MQLPDSIDYVEMRRSSFAADWSAEMAQHVVGLELPAEVHHAKPIRQLTHAFCDVVCLYNDIVSYRKETEREHDINNSVLVMQRLLGSDVQQAVAAVNNLAAARVRQFEYTIRSLVPQFFGKASSDPDAHAKILRYAGLLKDWMAGYVRWLCESGRYRMNRGLADAGWGARLRSGPMGLGTAAARLNPPARRAGSSQ